MVTSWEEDDKAYWCRWASRWREIYGAGMCLPRARQLVHLLTNPAYPSKGIFFKFALGTCSLCLWYYISRPTYLLFVKDIFNIYGGDAYAMYDQKKCLLLYWLSFLSFRKAANHDLKGLIGYYGCGIKSLHLPLMVWESSELSLGFNSLLSI